MFPKANDGTAPDQPSFKRGYSPLLLGQKPVLVSGLVVVLRFDSALAQPAVSARPCRCAESGFDSPFVRYMYIRGTRFPGCSKKIVSN